MLGQIRNPPPPLINEHMCKILYIVTVVSNSVEAGIFGLSYRMVRKMADKYDADLKRNQRPEFYNREIVMDRDEIYQDHKHTLRKIKKKIEVGIYTTAT